MKIHCTVNGAAAALEARPDEMLLEVLRRELGLHSVRLTCGIGVCGACTALLDGDPVATCILPAPQAEGARITTVEGLGGEHPVQRAFAAAHAFQCGFCTPGFVLTAISLLDEQPRPGEEDILHALGGNLCRCGSYLKIVEAVQLAAADQPEEAGR